MLNNQEPIDQFWEWDSLDETDDSGHIFPKYLKGYPMIHSMLVVEHESDTNKLEHNTYLTLKRSLSNISLVCLCEMSKRMVELKTFSLSSALRSRRSRRVAICLHVYMCDVYNYLPSFVTEQE